MGSLRDSLVAHWRLDEASGTRVDATGNGYDLTAVNNPGSTTGKIGNAALFAAASDQSLQSGAIASVTPSATSWTFAGWAREDSSTWGTILAMHMASGEAFEIQTFLDGGSGNGIYCDLEDDTGSQVGINTAPHPPYPGDGVWFFFVVWWDKDGGTVNLQIDDDTVYSAAATAVNIRTGTIASLWIGESADAGTPWDGAIDSVSFWTRTLTSAERTSLYNGGAGLDYPFVGPGIYRPISGPTNSTTIRTGATALGALDYAAAVDYAAVYDYAGAIATFSDVVTGGTTTTGTQDYAEQLDYAAAVDYAGLVPVYGYSAIVRQEGQ